MRDPEDDISFFVLSFHSADPYFQLKPTHSYTRIVYMSEQ